MLQILSVNAHLGIPLKSSQAVIFQNRNLQVPGIPIPEISHAEHIPVLRFLYQKSKYVEMKSLYCNSLKNQLIYTSFFQEVNQYMVNPLK